MYMITTEEKYEDGEVIFEEGSHGDWVYVVESGAVELTREVGGKKVVLEVVTPGDMFGELGFITQLPRTATARAVGETTVGLIERSYLDHEFNKLSSGFQKILRKLAVRLARTTRIACQAISPRSEFRTSKVFSLHFKGKQDVIQAFSGNISPRGIFINTDNPLNQGEQFVLHLFLPDDLEPLKISCEARWNRTTTNDPVSNPVGMGAKFIKMSQNDYKRLKDELDPVRDIDWSKE
ncbi:MAG TPA: cyclic nucleotide-binding domain-containing protein [Deltaproteobacteria bacterium]|nr:cyclic nucleotide-binding domain-containing protein [Deltaproteobacteria bacterium]